ncbi:MAG: trigger factor [Candidatus Buchananbacteria bacterium]|nr:trigger factor [Candidatus Buchananbacteria bacterium]
MKVEVKKLERGTAELTIELTVEEYQPFLEQAAKEISKHTKIPGFRPGKADLETVKKKVGEAEIWNQALEPAIHKTFVQALDEQQLITVGNPQVDIVKLAPGNPVVYKAIVSLLPKAEIADYKTITVAKKSITVSDEQINKIIDDIRKGRSAEAVVNREARMNDKVEIDFETFMDKVPIEHGEQKKFPLVIGEKTFIPGFEEQLVGMKKGETKKFQLEFPKNYHQKNLAGRLADFSVVLHEVYELSLPEINDEFAATLGNFKTVADLKDQIKNNLTLEEEHKESRRLEEEILDKIIEQSKFEDIPDVLIDSETKKMVDELEHNLSHQGIKFDEYLTHLNKTKADLLLDFVPQAIKRVKSALIIRSVADKEHVKATDEDIQNEIMKTLEAYGGNPDVEKQLSSQAYRDYLKNIIASQKVVEHLKSVMVK